MWPYLYYPYGVCFVIEIICEMQITSVLDVLIDAYVNLFMYALFLNYHARTCGGFVY
jgi:hypothetical protein